MTGERAALRIGELSRRTGVAVPTLRAWERRYGLLEPERTSGGHRLYRERDVDRVRSMQQLLGSGWSAAAAAREAIREPASVTQLRGIDGGGSAAQDLAERLESAIDRFDPAAVDHAVDDAFARFEVARAFDEVILPVLRAIGEGWEDDPRVIAREHVASNVLRPRLQRLVRSSATGPGQPVCLAAAPEDEEHDLGLLAAAATATAAGWRVHYLGARVPHEALQRGVHELRPDVVLIGAVHRHHAEAFLTGLPSLDDRPLVLGGAGFRAGDEASRARTLLHTGGMQELRSTLESALAARDATG